MIFLDFESKSVDIFDRILIRIIDIEVNIGVDVFIIHRFHRSPFIVGFIEDILYVIRLIALGRQCTGKGVVLCVIDGEKTDSILVHESCCRCPRRHLDDGAFDVERNPVIFFHGGYHDGLFGAGRQQKSMSRETQ